MAELAIASGIAGLASLIIEMVKITCAYTTDLASAERTVFNYLTTLRSLEAVLVQFGSLAEADRLKRLVPNRPQALSTAAIRDCHSHLTQIQNKINKRFTVDGHLKLLDALCWPLKKQETQDSIRALQQYRDTFHAALSIDLLVISVATHEEIRSSREHEAREKILRWLTPCDIEPALQSLSRSRHPGTCQWIFDHGTFKEWTSSTPQLLWCHGDPGSGKTILSGTIVEHLSMAATTLCHFCDHQTPEMDTPEAVMRDMIKQFTSQQPHIYPEIAALYDDAHKKPRTDGPTKGRLLEIFESICNHSTSPFIIIDALDECDNRRQLIEPFLSLTRTGARVLVISRSLPDLEYAFETHDQIEIRAHDADIEAYVRHKLDELDEDLEGNLSVELRATLSTTILARSSGLFLLCCLIMHDLQSCYNIAQIRKSLQKVPRNLSAMYEKTANQILATAEQRSPRALLAVRILSWVAYGVRALHIDELRHALATEKMDADVDHENLTSSKMIVSVCKGLMKSDDQGYCRFIHLTAYDFFRAHFSFVSDRVDLDIASTCLTYLSFKPFADSSCEDQTSLEQHLKEHPFLLYAGHFLGHHAKAVEEKLAAELLSFLLDPVLRSSFTQVCYFRNWRDKALLAQSYARLPTGQSALQIACGLGLIRTAKALLNTGEDVAAADDQAWTSLHSAASYEWTEILQQLVDQGANIEKADDQGWTPLFWAIIKGHVEAARLLRRSNALMQALDKSGWTPLDWAAYKGDEKMIHLLQPTFNNFTLRHSVRYGRLENTAIPR